jgi:hypothetical protein
VLYFDCDRGETTFFVLENLLEDKSLKKKRRGPNEDISDPSDFELPYSTMFL